MATIFIDGEAGTTGLGIRQRLAAQPGIAMRSLPSDLRKDVSAKRDLLREVDCVVLCLPDEAARETVALVDALGNAGPRVLDASTAHRVAPGWAYGFPELDASQSAAIAHARRVSNPGCFATGAIALLRPLVDAGLLPAAYPITINAASGYTGGGKSMIADYESRVAPDFELYGLGLTHKHIPEIQMHAGLTHRPIFVPSVADFAQGMLVSIPLHLDTLPNRPTARDVRAALATHYAEAAHVRVADNPPSGRLEAQALNDTNDMDLHVFAHPSEPQIVLVAKLDNLGKGASGAAVQNLALMLDWAPARMASQSDALV